MIFTKERRVNSEEEEYIIKWSFVDEINFWLYQSIIFIIFLPSGVLAAYYEGIFDEGGVALLAILITCLCSSYLIFKLEGDARYQQNYKNLDLNNTSGKITMQRKMHLYKYYINGSELRVPGHWETYLSEGDLVEAQVCSTPNKNYLLGTSSGLSIQRERENGYTAPFSHHPTSYYLLTLGTISACGVVAGVMFNLGWTGDPELKRPSTLTGFFDGPLELSFLFAALLLVPPTLWYIYRHFQDVAKIREMYEEEFGLEP